VSTARDGRPVSIHDYPAADPMTDTMLNSTTLKSVWTEHGRIVESEVQTIFADGKTLRDTDEGQDETGTSYNNRLVFERR
jgi:hypothetical protein